MVTNFKNMKKTTLLFAVLLSVFSLKAQDNTLYMWAQISPEIRFIIKDSPFEFRIKPDEHTFTPPKYISAGQVGQTDLLAGVKFWKCKFFGYAKFDYEGGSWAGGRLEYTEVWREKFILSLQTRYFFGINSKSDNHYYFIQYAGYQMDKSKSIGLLGLGKWGVGKDFNEGLWFLGPTLGIGDQKNFTLQVALLKDAFDKDLYMTYVELDYNINFKRKK